MKANMPYEAFMKKYKDATSTKDLLTTMSNEKDETGQDVVVFEGQDLFSGTSANLNVKGATSNYVCTHTGKWLYELTGYNDTEWDFQAMYILDDFKQICIPDRYTSMIQYADHIIDTTTQVIIRDRKKYDPKSIQDSTTKFIAFMKYYDCITSRPIPDVYFASSRGMKFYSEDLEEWDRTRNAIADSVRKEDPNFDRLLNAAVLNALRHNKYTNLEFEDCVEKYVSKKIALEFKRHRKPLGFCGNDNLGNNQHVLQIARLAAATTNWPVFVRSHFTLMNNKFFASRYMDSIEQQRTGFIALDVLGLRVYDLYLGTYLKTSCQNPNRYSSNNKVIGNIISRHLDKTYIESNLLQLISDNQLDDYNRLLGYQLFKEYNNSIPDKPYRLVNEQRLNTAVTTLPLYLSKQIGYD